MPFLPITFSAYPVSVVLDASGNGQLAFQATGQNLLISNVYASVGTQVKQAKVAFSKNNVGPQYNLITSNSGSTGCNTSGTVALLDGETLFVRWEGGDAGATATATFSGVVAPFLDVKGKITQLSVSDPIAAGDGSLIYPAIQSPNYVPGVSGWIIRRDGTFELSGGTFRGVLNIRDASTGRGVTISPANGQIRMFPENSAYGRTVNSGSIYAGLNETAGTANGFLRFASADVNNKPSATFVLRSEDIDGTPTSAQITAVNTTIGGNLHVNNSPITTGNIAAPNYIRISAIPDPTFTPSVPEFTPLASGVGNATKSITFAQAFPVGVVPTVVCQLTSGSGQVRGWEAIPLNITNTGFDFFIRSPAAATVTTAAANITGTYIATA